MTADERVRLTIGNLVVENIALNAKVEELVLTLDTNGYTVTIKVAGTAFTKGINFSQPWTGGGALVVEGDTTTPANATIAQSTTNGSGTYNSAIFAIHCVRQVGEELTKKVAELEQPKDKPADD